MDRRYYSFWFRIGGQKLCAIWSDNDYSKFWLDANGLLPAFSTKGAITAYAESIPISLENFEFEMVDLDELANWLEHPGLELDCNLVLNSWNLFDDLKTAVYGEDSYQAELQRPSTIYDKLYFGTNPPVLTPSNKEYVPIWTEPEIKEIQIPLADGLKLFRSKLACQTGVISPPN
jgi:hypothetical protein